MEKGPNFVLRIAIQGGKWTGTWPVPTPPPASAISQLPSIFIPSKKCPSHQRSPLSKEEFDLQELTCGRVLIDQRGKGETLLSSPEGPPASLICLYSASSVPRREVIMAWSLRNKTRLATEKEWPVCRDQIQRNEWIPFPCSSRPAWSA